MINSNNLLPCCCLQVLALQRTVTLSRQRLPKTNQHLGIVSALYSQGGLPQWWWRWADTQRVVRVCVCVYCMCGKTVRSGWGRQAHPRQRIRVWLCNDQGRGVGVCVVVCLLGDELEPTCIVLMALLCWLKWKLRGEIQSPESLLKTLDTFSFIQHKTLYKTTNLSYILKFLNE